MKATSVAFVFYVADSRVLIKHRCVTHLYRWSCCGKFSSEAVVVSFDQQLLRWPLPRQALLHWEVIIPTEVL